MYSEICVFALMCVLVKVEDDDKDYGRAASAAPAGYIKPMLMLECARCASSSSSSLASRGCKDEAGGDKMKLNIHSGACVSNPRTLAYRFSQSATNRRTTANRLPVWSESSVNGTWLSIAERERWSQNDDDLTHNAQTVVRFERVRYVYVYLPSEVAAMTARLAVTVTGDADAQHIQFNRSGAVGRHRTPEVL